MYDPLPKKQFVARELDPVSKAVQKSYYQGRFEKLQGRFEKLEGENVPYF